MKLTTALAALLALAAPAAAVAADVAIYPLERVGEDDDAATVQSLLDAAVHQAVRRSPGLRPAEPLVPRPRCGGASQATPACLAGVAGKGLVIRATVRRAQGFLVVAIDAVDRHGRTFGPVRVGLETVIQNSEPLTRAILDLTARAEAPPALFAATPGAAAAAALGVPPPPPPPRRTGSGWQTRAAGWFGAAGVVLATAGGMFAASQQTLEQKLDRKRAAGTFSEGDERWVAEADRYGTRSRTLLIAGGSCAAAGLALWAFSPSVAPVPGGATVGVGGKF